MDAYSPLALSQEIEAFRREFEQIAADADALTAGLTDEQFAWAPAPGVWSVGQCLDHLNATARAYLPRLDDGIADAIRRGLYGPGPYVYNWPGRLMVHVVRPESTVRARAPRAFQPGPTRSRQEIMSAFRAYQVQYVDRLRQANGLDLGRARVSSPVSRWIRMSLGSGFALMVAHERRHLAQAGRVIAAPAFPR